MCPKHADEPELEAKPKRASASKYVAVENLPDLNPYTDVILEAFNADKRLALLAVADPVGVLRDLGYALSPQAARELRHCLPRMSREQRDRYLRWMRGLGDIPDTIDIRLVSRPSGRDLLRGSGKFQVESETLSQSVGQGAGGFDVVAQFGEALCDRMLKRNYAFGNLPRSVYRINGSLQYYFGSGEYESMRSSSETADREIHFNQPSMTFPANKTDTVRFTSAFITLGFAAQEIKGTVSVDAKVAIKKDSQGQPGYVELTFDSLTAAEITVTISSAAPSAAVSSELQKMILDVYKSFRKLKYPEPAIPLSFTLVDSAELAGKGSTTTVKTTVGIRQPAGASAPVLLVGVERTGNAGSGDLNAVACAIKSGGDFALVQDSGWLEEHVNDSFIASLPFRFDPDSGQSDPNGDLRVDTITWRYRDGGLTGAIAGVQENAYLWIDTNIKGEARVDMAFHSSEPTLTITGSSDISEADCWAKLVFILLMVLLGALIGGLAGALIGAVAGGAVAAGALIGGIAGGSAGLITGIVLTKWGQFDSSGMSATTGKQEMKVTHSRTLPETGGTVTVKPNDFGVNADGTRMSAMVIGPNYVEAQPSITIQGSFSADFSLAESGISSGDASNAAGGRNSGTNVSIAGLEKGVANQISKALSQNRLMPNVVGTISLDYSVVSASGLQGKLSYLWAFNGKPIGTLSEIKVDVPVTADMVKGFEFNQANVLGVVSVSVADSFGRSASASETITVGNPEDLRAFVPAVVEQRGYIDPIEQVGQRYGDPARTVGWQKEGSTVAQTIGALKSYSTVSINGKDYAIVGTQKV